MEDAFSDLLGGPKPQPSSGIPKTPELPSVVHESTLAALLGVNRSRIAQLVRDGVLQRAGRAQFELKKSVHAYAENLRDKTRRIGPGASANPATAELNEAKLRLTRAQADEREVKLALTRGELVEALAVERAWAAVLRDVRAAMLAVPSRCGAGLPHLSAHDIATIETEIRAALEGLADGD